ncbi:MAG: class I SAM-dependent methyltransferase [Candidatus Krumholzibacteriia bacterium]
MPTYTKDTCPIRGSSRFRVIGGVDVDRSRITPPNQSSIVACSECDLVYVNPTPHWTDEDFHDLYGHGYFEEYSPGWRRKRARAIPQRRSSLIDKHVQSSSKTMLEFGAGVHPFMSRHMADRGWKVTAQEPSRVFAEELRRIDPRITVLETPFLEIPSDKKYSLVYADSVLEHVPNPTDYFTKAADLLEPGGILYFVSPNEFALTNKILTFKNKYSNRVAHQLCPYHDSFHLIGYSRKAVGKIEETTGLRLLQFIRKHDFRSFRILEDVEGVLKYPKAVTFYLMDRLGLGLNLEVILRAEG